MKAKFSFESYGVKISLRSNSQSYLKKIVSVMNDIFPMGWTEIEFSEENHLFEIDIPKSRQSQKTIKKNGEVIFSVNGKLSIESIESQLRLTVAEFADDVVFIHGGAVGYKDTGIIIPGKSFAGKTTLVAELIKRGLTYYSDEYAVLDKEGLLHPYTKTLSMRGIIDSYTQKEIPAEEFGAKKGIKPIKICCILICQYKYNARIRFTKLTPGEAIIETIANSVSIRRNPQIVLETVNKVVSDSLCVKTKRSEVEIFADKFIKYLESENI